MPLLIIQPNNTTQEAREWLLDVIIFLVEHTDLDEEAADALAYEVETMEHEDVDATFNYAIERLQ